MWGLLPDHEIRKYIKIDPLAEGVKRPGLISYGLSGYGYDARLGDTYKVFTPVHADLVVDPKKIDDRAYHIVKGNHCIIPPNSYVLAESFEYFEIPRDVIAVCLGKSTYARCAAIVNTTPLEPEWCGKITIEISNSGPLPIKIHSFEGIMQILFFRAMSECEKSYKDKGGKYQNQKGLTLPKVY